MNHLNKGKAKYISVLTLVLLLLTITLYGSADVFCSTDFHSILTNDTIPVKPIKDLKTDSLKKQDQKNKDELLLVNKNSDTTIVGKTDTLIFKSSKEALDAPVIYHADDSMVMDIPAKKIILYGKKASVKYLDNELYAPLIEYDQQNNIMNAYFTKDRNENVISYAQFNQGEIKTQSDTVRYNPKTQKGLSKGTYTQQDEIYVYSERFKKVDDNTFYAFRGRFTTCNLDTPHFSFVSKRIKFINKKMAITGPVHPEVENVPIPVYLPFGIYPLQQGRHSGILAPTFTANAELGLALEGLGYYKVLNQNWDCVLRCTIFSFGGGTHKMSPMVF